MCLVPRPEFTAFNATKAKTAQLSLRLVKGDSYAGMSVVYYLFVPHREAQCTLTFRQTELDHIMLLLRRGVTGGLWLGCERDRVSIRLAAT